MAGEDLVQPKFAVSQRVRVRDWTPPGHVRTPSFVRGYVGTIKHVAGTLEIRKSWLTGAGIPQSLHFTECASTKTNSGPIIRPMNAIRSCWIFSKTGLNPRSRTHE